MNQPEPTPSTITAPVSAGQMLRAAREAQGLHLAMLSATLKVSVRRLQALEADQYEAFSGMAFVRALAQSVCRQLHIDSAPVLAALPQVTAQLVIEPTTLDARQSVRMQPRVDSSKGLSRQALVLAVLMLLGAAGLMWWPSGDSGVLAVVEDLPDPNQAAVPMGQASDPEQIPVQPASTEQVSLAAPAIQASSAARLPAAVASSAAVKASSAPVVVSESTTASGSAVAAPLRIRVQSDMWIEVRDARGQMLVKRMVNAGESLQFSTAPPLFVYVGKADAAELRWQGQVLDLKPHTANNEARLQIKP